MIEFVRIELSDEKPLELMVFEQDAGTQLALFSEDNQHQILFGEFRDTMYIQRVYILMIPRRWLDFWLPLD